MKILFLNFLLLLSSLSFSQAIYKNFDNWKQAASYYRTNIGPFVAGIEGHEGYKIISSDKKIYTRARAIIKDLHSAYLRLYSSQIKFQAPPYVIILDSDIMSALSPTNPENSEKPYFFVANKGIFKLSNQALTGIFAHELAHLYLQWHEGAHSFPAEKFYTKGKHIAFGKSIKHDDVLKKSYLHWENIREQTGPFSYVELGGIPLHYDPSAPSHFRQIKYLLSIAPQNNQCKEAKRAYMHYVKTVMINYFSYDTLTLALNTSKDRQIVQKLSSNLENKLSLCLKGIHHDYTELQMAIYGLSQEIVDSIKKNMSGIEKETFTKIEKYYSSMDSISALFSVTKDFRKKLIEVERKMDFDSIRIYNHEDHADEVAVEILHHLKVSPDKFNEFLLKYLTAKNQVCPYKSLKSEPAYGPFENPHHSPCWRAYRNHNYLQTL